MGTRTLIRFVAPARACRLSDPPRKKLSAHGSTAEEFIFHVGRHSLCVNGHVQDAKRMWSLQVVLRHLSQEGQSANMAMTMEGVRYMRQYTQRWYWWPWLNQDGVCLSRRSGSSL